MNESAMSEKIYKESGIELSPFIASHYDSLMNTLSFGRYDGFIRKAIQDMGIQEEDEILDMGCGTGKNAAIMAHFLGKTGSVTGVDLSPVMEKQFREKHQADSRIDFSRQRIDIPFDLGKRFDKILLSFVIHGFPQEVREKILQNAQKHLKPGGQLFILDYAEFEMASMPWHHRFIFKKVECVYAFDFIEKDLKSMLGAYSFHEFNENLYFRKYARLLSAKKEKNTNPKK